ncbi:DUF3685 domain-containing protein [Mastigocoleus testarum]|uniref:Regulator n=1 Tax=Mastigocoleus testarum BC008 TaxID=371196 RepID=A0A0V7ZRX1_9CYAN|nr:DUF3685 domain-containing protein [Mastigocoleus testarum]KST67321.1 regulator [Mastigocoleus testarum BC008]
MSDRPLNLLLIDPDPIFRLGLRMALEQEPNLQVISEAQTDIVALQILAELALKDPNQVNLVILELGNGRSEESQQLGLQLCRQIKALYPNLPLLLVTSSQDRGLLLGAKALGVDGYCPKGTPLNEIVAAIEIIASGQNYWFGSTNNEEYLEDVEGQQKNQVEAESASSTQNLTFSEQIEVTEEVGNTQDKIKALSNRLIKLRNYLYSSGSSYINNSLTEVKTQLQVPGIPILDRAVLTGRQRELFAARWLLQHLVAPSSPTQEAQKRNNLFKTKSSKESFANSAIATYSQPKPLSAPSLLSPRALQSILFSSCINKLQFSLQNVTDTPLEIDIFREAKKRELIYLILQKFANILDDLRFAKIAITRLPELRSKILRDLWQETITEFYGKFSLINVDKRPVEIINVLLKSLEIIEEEILEKIPLVPELLAYLLFQTDLYINNNSYPAGSAEANEHGSMVLENLLIQLGNAAVQPLLNCLGDLEVIKQNYYEPKLFSTREIESFRNNLSWKYRLQNYIGEPKAIFESRYELFVFGPRGLAKISIYAPRGEELNRLGGVPLIVTLMLEFSDAVKPRLQAIFSLLGSGVVFVLTKVVGRSLGLIGRGIIQGIGSVSLTERKK